ncbi:MAG: DUF4881 domain-containing protein, partial [Desulfobacteraceae bacterium]|nr:DUF4881 domain-containing protein [Desulfobacteraceae bacterium]
MARYFKLLLAIVLILPVTSLITGCEYGKVDQGRVVKFDKEKGTVTFIRDVKNDSHNPEYTHLPPITYAIPKEPKEMGEEPKAGLRMKIDTKKNEITVFDPATQQFKTIQYTLIDQKENVGKNDPAVFDEAQKKAKKLPAIDRDKKTITIYSSRQKTLTTFSLPAEYFDASKYPESTWDSGDEVRVYYKEEGKAR